MIISLVFIVVRRWLVFYVPSSWASSLYFCAIRKLCLPSLRVLRRVINELGSACMLRCRVIMKALMKGHSEGSIRKTWGSSLMSLSQGTTSLSTMSLWWRSSKVFVFGYRDVWSRAIRSLSQKFGFSDLEVCGCEGHVFLKVEPDCHHRNHLFLEISQFSFIR